MHILEKDQLKRDLQLNFHSTWPQSMPLAAWGNQLISNDSGSNYAIDYSNEQNMTLPKLIKEIYPSLSLSELSYLYSKWSKNETVNSIESFSWEQIFQAYNLRWCENLKKTLLSIQKLSLDFQEWARQKKCMQNDLAPLRRINDFTTLDKYLTQIIHFNPTKTQGVQLLDILCDLIELEELEKLEPAFSQKNLKKIEKNLRKLRYPISEKDSENKATKIKNWPWPMHTEAKWNRRGDKAGIEIKIFVSSQEEFAKKINGLQHVVSYTENHENNLW